MANPMAWPALAATSIDWAYESVPQPGASGAGLPFPCRRVLGGSSGINGMMHIRGDRRADDAWERAGAVGWNYESLLPFFRKARRRPGTPPTAARRDPCALRPSHSGTSYGKPASSQLSRPGTIPSRTRTGHPRSSRAYTRVTLASGLDRREPAGTGKTGPCAVTPGDGRRLAGRPTQPARPSPTAPWSR